MKRILVVDDNLASRSLLAKYLSKYGEITETINGREAVGLFKKTLQGELERFDLICLDIVMPEVDGREALKTIRQLEKEYSVSGADRVKIIMATALDDRMDIIESFNEGCEGYVVKPVEKEHLYRVVDQLGL